MATNPAEPEKPDEKEAKAALIKTLKLTRSMYFALVPKSYLGRLVICLTKDDRDEAAAATKQKISGGIPVKGICKGPLNAKVFTLDKKNSEVEMLSIRLQRIVKRTTGLTIFPDVKIKGVPDEDDDE